ncbi:hypothetical protein B0H17DRAFT_3493 [Mycena rosella]|uniref:Uncharacterized protein n=1 Tax=Mycena rosella TaxID=1033263 RepID=A0AAD7H2V3_MYCRO|nr:hypothetical protein B0H17DRAFT_3493 [Mycena rosella]
MSLQLIYACPPSAESRRPFPLCPPSCAPTQSPSGATDLTRGNTWRARRCLLHHEPRPTPRIFTPRRDDQPECSALGGRIRREPREPPTPRIRPDTHGAYRVLGGGGDDGLKHGSSDETLSPLRSARSRVPRPGIQYPSAGRFHCSRRQVCGGGAPRVSRAVDALHDELEPGSMLRRLRAGRRYQRWCGGGAPRVDGCDELEY